jgi:hypothetical protein
VPHCTITLCFNYCCHFASLDAGSPSKKASKLFSSLRRAKSRSTSPLKAAAGGRDRSPSKRSLRRGTDGTSGSGPASRRTSEELEDRGAGG